MHRGHCEQQAGGGCANKEMVLCVSARMTGKPHAQGMGEGSKCCSWLAKHSLGVKERQVQHALWMHKASKLCWNVRNVLTFWSSAWGSETDLGRVVSCKSAPALASFESCALSSEGRNRRVGLPSFQWLQHQPYPVWLPLTAWRDGVDSKALLLQASFQEYLHDPRGIFAVGFYFVWVDNLMSVFKFKFRTAIGSQFWHLLQEVLHQVLVFLGIPEKGYWKELKRALEILGRLKKKKSSFCWEWK